MAKAKGVTVDGEKSPAAKACEAAAKSTDPKGSQAKDKHMPKPPAGKPFFNKEKVY